MLPLKQCHYCNRPEASDGSIYHEGGCAGLERVVLNRLQYDALVARGAATEADIFASFPIGTLFQKHESGNIVALTPEGGNTVIQPKTRPGGLDCGVDLRTGKPVCVCGRCTSPNQRKHEEVRDSEELDDGC